MAWEILAIWLIVATAIVLFIRDERRMQFERLAERARNYATAPAWQDRDGARRPAGLPPQPVRLRPAQDLTALQRHFAEAMRRSRQ
jgi:hypothetical protein